MYKYKTAALVLTMALTSLMAPAQAAEFTPEQQAAIDKALAAIDRMLDPDLRKDEPQLASLNGLSFGPKGLDYNSVKLMLNKAGCIQTVKQGKQELDRFKSQEFQYHNCNLVSKGNIVTVNVLKGGRVLALTVGSLMESSDFPSFTEMTDTLDRSYGNNWSDDFLKANPKSQEHSQQSTRWSAANNAVVILSVRHNGRTDLFLAQPTLPEQGDK